MLTGKVVYSLPEARNTLTQRPFADYTQTIPTTAVTRMEVDHMKNGDIAGLAVFQSPYAYIGVKKVNGSKYIVMVHNGKTVDSLAINNSTIYLRTIASNNKSKASFEYSFDNKIFNPLGNELFMRFDLSIFTGNKFCLFNYATRKVGGYVDFDWFRVN